VDDGHVGDADALGHGQEDIPSSTRAGGGAIRRFAGAVDEIGEWNHQSALAAASFLCMCVWLLLSARFHLPVC
jgi:hypothetical protein